MNFIHSNCEPGEGRLHSHAVEWHGSSRMLAKARWGPRCLGSEGLTLLYTFTAVRHDIGATREISWNIDPNSSDAARSVEYLVGLLRNWVAMPAIDCARAEFARLVTESERAYLEPEEKEALREQARQLLETIKEREDERVR